LFEFILADANLPFAVSLGLMLGIAVLEGTMTLLGAGLSQAIDSLLPESLGDLDIDADIDLNPDIANIDGTGADFGHAELSNPDVGSVSALSRVLGWLCVGKVPILILLVAFLTVFGLAGLVIQSVMVSFTGVLLPGILASIPALVIAIPSVRVIGTGIAKLIPKDETSAMGSDTFIGRVATITVGTARFGVAAEAKLIDTNGQIHYVMVEPDSPDIEFSTGTKVLIIEKYGSRFHAILNTNSALTDD